MFKSIITTLLIVIAINPSFAQVASVMPDNSATASVKTESDPRLIVQTTFNQYFETVGTVMGMLEKIGAGRDDESLTANVDSLVSVYFEVTSATEATIYQYGSAKQQSEFKYYKEENYKSIAEIYNTYFGS